MEAIFISFLTDYRPQLIFTAETSVKIAVFLGGIMSLAGALTLGERKISALMQDRIGPNRAAIFGIAWWGIFHPMADGIKLIAKEDFVPREGDKFLFTIAPLIGMVAVLACFAFIPFGNYLEIYGFKIRLLISDIDAGFFLILAISSMAVYSAVFGGLFSGNNFGLLGGLRAAAQMISYEVILGISLVPLLMIYSTGSLQSMILAQGGAFLGIFPKWGIFLQPLAFIIFFTASLAESKRTPFDVVEGESEIIGYFIEYGSMRFAVFMFTEYVEIVFVSMLAAVFFFGGWQFPFLETSGFVFPGGLLLPLPAIAVSLLQMGSFAAKTVFFSFLIVVLRWTLPRFRFDQIMKLAWQFLLPLAIFNIFLTGLILNFFR